VHELPRALRWLREYLIHYGYSRWSVLYAELIRLCWDPASWTGGDCVGALSACLFVGSFSHFLIWRNPNSIVNLNFSKSSFLINQYK
jgi:hypothetical protein